jgi:hypothetical protein
MNATVRPGVEWLMDHRVFYLKEALTDPAPSFMLSFYTFRYASAGGSGNVAFVRYRSESGMTLAIVSDNLPFASRNRERFAPRAYVDAFVRVDPTLGTFTGRPPVDDAWTIRASGLEITAEWLNLEPAMLAYGPSPMRPDVTDTFSVLRPAGAGRVTVNGAPVPGLVYPNDVWTPWVGRPLSSCMLAIDEAVVFRS